LCSSEFERERTKPLLFHVCCSGRLSSPMEMLPEPAHQFLTRSLSARISS
jgi:hypothetical protein